MKLEIGWLVVGALDPADRAASRAACDSVLETLRSQLPEFDWQIRAIEQPGASSEPIREPAELFEVGVIERDARGFDFVLVLTGSDLVSHYKAQTLAVPAGALDVGVISTARIDPEAEGRALGERARCELMARRIAALALCLIGRLNSVDIDPGGEGKALLEALDGFDRLPDSSLGVLRERLTAVADPRLEEEARLSVPAFFIGAAWRNLPEIAHTIARARPWTIPFRLSRLTTVAVSAVVLLLMTAEAWDVALAQQVGFLVSMSVVVWIGTTSFVLVRQRLQLGRLQRTEQAVSSAITVTAVLAAGMLATFACLFGLAAILSTALFPTALVERWASGAAGGIVDHLKASTFLATLGLLIGALGASFEKRRYLHHIAYADDEI